MPLLENTFRCTNGHDFKANAKIRARCPECGASTKRNFDKLVEKATAKLEEPKKDPIVTPAKKKAGPVLIRQGRPRVMVAKKSPVKTKPKGTTIIGSHSAGLVKSHTITRHGTRPQVTGRPPKTAIARGIKAGKEVVAPYWHSVADRFGF